MLFFKKNTRSVDSSHFILITIIFFTLSCQSGQENKQIIENLKKENEMLKQRSDHIEKVNQTLEKELRNIEKNLYLQEQIKEQGFLIDTPTKDIQILTQGEFHGNDVVNDATKLDWYGIFKQEDKFILKKTKLIVTQIRDAIVDQEGEISGKNVKSVEEGEPILFITGLKDIKVGEIKSVKLEKQILYPGEGISVEFNGYWTGFSAYGTSMWGHHGGDGVTNYLLEIGSSKDSYRTTQIFAGTNRVETLFRFLWTGDIDGDGLLDLIMDLSNNEVGARNITLFLSSKAEKGQLIKKVAEFLTRGC